MLGARGLPARGRKASCSIEIAPGVRPASGDVLARRWRSGRMRRPTCGRWTTGCSATDAMGLAIEDTLRPAARPRDTERTCITCAHSTCDGVTVATVLPFAAGPSRSTGTSYEPPARLLRARRPWHAWRCSSTGTPARRRPLTPEERAEVIRRTRASRAGQCLVMAGIIATCTSDAIARAHARPKARRRRRGRALFPLPQYLGRRREPTREPDPRLCAMQVAELRRTIPLSHLPVPAAPRASGFTTAVLRRDRRQAARSIAIKEGSGDIRAYEDNVAQALKAAAPHVAMLPSNFDWFLAQLVDRRRWRPLGPREPCCLDLFVELWRATERPRIFGCDARRFR